MGRAWLIVLCLFAAACAEQPVREGRLPSGEGYREFSREPHGYRRVIYGADGAVRETQELHTEENFRRIRPGMTVAEIEQLIGVGYGPKASYADGTRSHTYRYRDVGIAKLLHVTFGPDGRVLRYATEWDPAVYSKDDGMRSK